MLFSRRTWALPCFLIVFSLLLVFANPLAAFAQSTPAPTDASGSSDGGGCFLGVICQNPATWLQQTITSILTDFLSGVADDFGEAIVGFLNQVNFLTRTPENLSYSNDLVKQYASATQILANGLLAVVVVITGYNVVLRPYMGATYVGAREVLPRLLLGGILINTAGWWCRLAIDVNNATCGVFGAPNIADMVSTMLRVILDPTHVSGLLMLLVATIMAILLLIQQLMRLALVDVLLILAPLAAVLWILPQSQAWGRLWGRLFIGTVFAQAVQVLTLRLGFNLTTDLPPLTASGLLQPLLGIAVLALVLKMPGLMGRSGAGGNIVANLMGTAAGAAVASGVGVAVRGAVGAGARTGARAGAHA
jgi:Conjugal transfer protein TrbL